MRGGPRALKACTPLARLLGAEGCETASRPKTEANKAQRLPKNREGSRKLRRI